MPARRSPAPPPVPGLQGLPSTGASHACMHYDARPNAGILVLLGDHPVPNPATTVFQAIHALPEAHTWHHGDCVQLVCFPRSGARARLPAECRGKKCMISSRRASPAVLPHGRDPPATICDRRATPKTATARGHVAAASSRRWSRAIRSTCCDHARGLVVLAA